MDKRMGPLGIGFGEGGEQYVKSPQKIGIFAWKTNEMSVYERK